MIPDSLTSSVEKARLDRRKVDELLARVRREVDEGLLSGVQVALARDGRLALLESFGDLRDDSLVCVVLRHQGRDLGSGLDPDAGRQAAGRRDRRRHHPRVRKPW